MTEDELKALEAKYALGQDAPGETVLDLVAEVRRLKHQLAEEMAAHDETTEGMNAAFLERDQQYHETRRYRDALEWYGQPTRWERQFTTDAGGMHYFVHDDIEDDLGKRARVALGWKEAT